MSSINEFVERFVFVPEYAFRVGVERECFLRNLKTSEIVPQAGLVYARLQESKFAGNYGSELSACQMEYRTDPLYPKYIGRQLLTLETELQLVLAKLGLYGDFCELAEDPMPMDVYPERRYLQIAESLPPEVLSAACRVAGTHVHVGMRDLETAIKVYNCVIRHVYSLNERGDFSNGERMRLYRVMAQHLDPPEIRDTEHFYTLAKEQGFVENPRNCWALIRITVHGTIEFRSFGSVSSIKQIIDWVKLCHALCLDAYRSINVEHIGVWGF